MFAPPVSAQSIFEKFPTGAVVKTCTPTFISGVSVGTPLSSQRVINSSVLGPDGSAKLNVCELDALGARLAIQPVSAIPFDLIFVQVAAAVEPLIISVTVAVMHPAAPATQ